MNLIYSIIFSLPGWVHGIIYLIIKKKLAQSICSECGHVLGYEWLTVEEIRLMSILDNNVEEI